jgi:hypothetical protein
VQEIDLAMAEAELEKSYSPSGTPGRGVDFAVLFFAIVDIAARPSRRRRARRRAQSEFEARSQPEIVAMRRR